VNDLLHLARPDLLDLEPYAHAAWEPSLERLHANESPWRILGDNSTAGLNRYPEPQPRELVSALASLYAVEEDSVLIGRGSDEAIDLLVRGFCRAGHDAVMIFPPTFGMYAVAARIQGAGVLEVPLRLDDDFRLDVDEALRHWRAGVKIVFVCSPNNPTGTLIPVPAIERLCAALDGKALVVVDEAYLEFADGAGVLPTRALHPNLVILRTLSKAFALAGARCGTLIAHPALVSFLRRMIPPYALPTPTIEAALKALEAPSRLHARSRIAQIVAERERVATALRALPAVRRVWPSAGNFLLVAFVDAARALQSAIEAGLLVRDVRRHRGLANCLRITIGTSAQNHRLLDAVRRA
jgi:histidinol-phosphate aminotransferase